MLIHNRVQLDEFIEIYVKLKVDFEVFFRMDFNDYKIKYLYGAMFIQKNNFIFQDLYENFSFTFPIEIHD